MKRIGLIVNPIAGMGGPAGMKGSDSPEAVRRAVALGVAPLSQKRTVEVLKKVREQYGGRVIFVTAPSSMGEAAVREAGFDHIVCGNCGQAGETTAFDTERIAGEIAAQKVDLLIFSGGDGTARNICNAVGQTVPCFGIPTGVKMHSGVFALHPSAAASILVTLLEEGCLRYRPEEVVDLDESEYARGNVETRLYGYLSVPILQNCLQGTKAGRQPSEEQAVGEIGRQMARIIAEAKEYCFAIGAGTTTMAIKKALGIDGTLLGVDVCRGGDCLVKDANAMELERVTKAGGLKIIVSPIGGQGYLFGRGNQQFTHGVIAQAGKENVIVVCSPGKLEGLEQQPFRVDTGDEALDKQLRGYVRVKIGWDTEIVYRIE